MSQWPPMKLPITASMILMVTAALAGCLTSNENPAGSSAAPTVTTGANETFRGAAAYAATAYFVDDGDNAKTWTLEKKTMASDNGVGPGTNRVVDEPNPLAAGWHVSTKDKFSGAKSWTIQDESKGGYHDNEYDIMTSPTIDLAGAVRVNLTFAFRAGLEDNMFDGLQWYVGEPGGTFKLAGSAYSPSAEWRVLGADLSAYAGKKVQLQFVFQSDTTCSIDDAPPSNPGVSCGPGSYSGVFIDDIVVRPA